MTRRVVVLAIASCAAAIVYAITAAALVDALITASTLRHPAGQR